MYKDKDPRASMAATGYKKPPKVAPSADLLTFGPSSGKTNAWDPAGWHVRGQNFLVHFVLPQVNATFESKNHPDEQLILLSEPDTELLVKTDTEELTVKGYSLLVLPPGNSLVTVLKTGRIQRFMTSNSAPELCKMALNADSYRSLNEQVAPCVSWPDPIGGFKIRVYSLDVPDQPGRFGRIWRTTNFMINVFAEQLGPRDKEKLSPHDHWDFEQCSVGITGSFVHHLRWPWGPNRLEWRADEHKLAPSPSVQIIPPTVEHTTEAVGTGSNQLIDFYCPPRVDFSEMGWVLNADEYPAPLSQS
jgi:hypothetical protein